MQEASGPDFRPLYSQIKELLIKRLAAREWKPGDALPSEIALANEYGVSQGTLRKALNEMEAERLVVRRQGKGTFAAKHSAKRSLFQFFHLVGENGERQLPESRVLECRAGRATQSEREALGLEAGTSVTRILRVRHLNGRPVIFERISVATPLFPELQRCTPEEVTNTLYDMYETRYGVVVVRAKEQLRAVAANEEDSQLLGVPVGAPLLEIDRTALNIEHQPVEWRVSRCDTAHHFYLNELD
ncbi:GntR family transcriptional regulator [Acidihalobacter prosperus]